MSILLAQIAGGIFGLIVAWLINYYFTMYHKKANEELKRQHMIELENFKINLKKSVK